MEDWDAIREEKDAYTGGNAPGGSIGRTGDRHVQKFILSSKTHWECADVASDGIDFLDSNILQMKQDTYRRMTFSGVTPRKLGLERILDTGICGIAKECECELSSSDV